MSTSLTSKQDILKQHRVHATDTASPEVQVALLSQRINGLTEHVKSNKNDHSSRRGLLGLVSQRRSLLDYLNHTHPERYTKLIATLNLRK